MERTKKSPVGNEAGKRREMSLEYNKNNALESTLQVSREAGRYRRPCPHCDRGRSDTALSILVEPAGLCWYCWRCGWSGGSRGTSTVARPMVSQDSESNRRRLRRIWQATETLDLARHFIARTYLESRGLDLERAPGDLRFGWIDYWQTQEDKPELVGKFPALVAVVRTPNGEPAGLHRTYLRPDGTGKADLDPARKLCPPARPNGLSGGALRLCEAAESLIVAEGIETALAASQATQKPAWAALSTSGLQNVRLPRCVTDVTIAADNDPAGIKAAERLADHLRHESRTVRLAIPERPGADWNDVIREVAA